MRRHLLHRLRLLAALLVFMAAVLLVVLEPLRQRAAEGIDDVLSASTVAGLTVVQLLLVVAILLIAVLALLGGGRLVGRYVRRPGPSRLPGRLGPSADRARARHAAVTVELELARESFSEPYEVAKLFDGLSGLLRPRLRGHTNSLLGPASIALEQRALPDERRVAFLISAPAYLVTAVTARLQACYPGLRTTPAQPSPLTSPETKVVALRAKKTRHWMWSLQTTKDYTHSPVESLVQTIHASGVRVCVQLLITPAPRWLERRAGRLIRREEKYAGLQAASSTEAGIESMVEQKQLRGAVECVGRSLYHFDLRVLAPAEQRGAAVAAVAALNEARAENELAPRQQRVRRRLTQARVRLALPRLIPGLWTALMSGAELATCWHLPGVRLKGAGLHRQPSREITAPASISRNPAHELLRDEHGPVGISPADLRFGHAIMGAAGAGKSSILLAHIHNVARDRTRAAIIIDLKEDLAKDALTAIPTNRVVHYLDLARPRCGLNILAASRISAEVRADILISAIRETAGPDSVGPRSDSFLRSAITAVCTCEEKPTLAHVQRMLDPYDPGYRDWVIRELSYHHEVHHIRDFWEREFPAMLAANPRFVAEALAAPRNKLARFLSVPSLELALSHPVFIDLEQLVENREILIVNGSKDAVGEENAKLFCQLVVLLLQRALHRLQTREREDRRQVRVIIDEAHNLFTPSFATMISEGRSAGLEVIAAFQYSAQITDERVKAGIRSLLQNITVTRLREFDDARSLAALAMELFTDAIRVDPADQRRLTIDPMDIVNMPNHRALNLWLADGRPQPAFTAQTVPIEPRVTGPRALATRSWHEQRNRELGWHPHDEGRHLAPALIRDLDAIVQVHERSVHVDLTAWTSRPELTAQSTVVIELVDIEQLIPVSRHPALASDKTGRRWHAEIPEDDRDPLSVPDGTYDVNVIVREAGRPARRWQVTRAEGTRNGERRMPCRAGLKTVAVRDPLVRVR